MEKINFKEYATAERDRLIDKSFFSGENMYGPSASDLYINEEKTVAVIGIQRSCWVTFDKGCDSIYVLTEEGLKKLATRGFISGRLWVTGLSDDGEVLSWSLKNNSGEKFEATYNIKTGKGTHPQYEFLK